MAAMHYLVGSLQNRRQGDIVGRRIGVIATLALIAISGIIGATTAQASTKVFATMNDSGGVAWRSAPNWNSSIGGSGRAVYPGTNISVLCYQLGAGNVPGSTDQRWVQASWWSGSGWGSGWINEHFINDGQPINKAAPGVTPCGASHTFPTMNDSGGVYWRSDTSWTAPISHSGEDVYPGTHVNVVCYQLGAGNVPGSTDQMWVQAYWVSGAGWGAGWINEHFINDGQPINKAAPGVPACSAGVSTPNKAITWARQHLGQDYDSGWCLLFVQQAYSAAGINIGVAPSNNPTAVGYWQLDPKHYSEHPGDKNPAVGALVFWGATRSNSAGHVGIYEGNNVVISTSSWPESGNQVHEWSFSGRNAAGYPYLGWFLP